MIALSLFFPLDRWFFLFIFLIHQPSIESSPSSSMLSISCLPFTFSKCILTNIHVSSQAGSKQHKCAMLKAMPLSPRCIPAYRSTLTLVIPTQTGGKGQGPDLANLRGQARDMKNIKVAERQ